MEAAAGIYLFTVFFILAFLTDKLPFLRSARTISALSRNSIQTIQSAELDDDTKQKNLLNNSLGIFRESFLIFVCTAIVGGVLLLFLNAAEWLELIPYNFLVDFLISIPGISLSVLAFTSYFLFRSFYGRFRL